MSDAPRELVFDRDFLDDLTHWVSTDRKVALKVLELVEAIRRDPFTGLGKPEPLRHALAGWWSRRLDQEHRLVYRVTERGVELAQMRLQFPAVC